MGMLMTRVQSQHTRALIMDAAAERSRKIRDYDRLVKMVDALLAHCPDAECSECAKVVCPHGEPLHFHHDGCPACSPPTVSREQIT